MPGARRSSPAARRRAARAELCGGRRRDRGALGLQRTAQSGSAREARALVRRGRALIARREPGLFLASTLVDHTKVDEAVTVILDTLRGLAATRAPNRPNSSRAKRRSAADFPLGRTIDGITGVLGRTRALRRAVDRTCQLPAGDRGDRSGAGAALRGAKPSTICSSCWSATRATSAPRSPPRIRTLRRFRSRNSTSAVRRRKSGLTVRIALPLVLRASRSTCACFRIGQRIPVRDANLQRAVEDRVEHFGRSFGEFAVGAREMPERRDG